jgi:tetratricopeptide (TPR) repeat protein
LALAASISACAGSPQARKADHVQKAERYVSAGKLAEAVIEYRLAVEADPQAGDAQLALADAYFKVGDMRHAAQAYVRAADLLPSRLDVQLKAGTFMLAGGRFDDAKVRAEKALAITPGDVDSHILLANALAGLRDPEGAMAQIEEAVNLDPKRSATYTSLASIEIGRGRAEAAEQAFRRAIELDDKSTMAHLAAGNFYWASGRLPEAERELSRGLALQPDNVIAREIMGAFFIASNRAAEAEPHLKRVFELTNSPGSALALTDFYLSRNDQKAARELLETLKNRPDTKNQAKLRLAALDHAAGRKDQAYAQIAEVLASDPKNLTGLLAKSSFLLTDRRNDEALATAEITVQAYSDSAAAFYTLGQIQTARKQIDAAIAAYDTAVRLNPRAVAAKIGLAELHLAAGRSQASLGFAEDALKSEPDNPDARLALVKGLVGKGDIPRAATELKGLAQRYPKSPAVLIQTGIVQARQNDTASARNSFQEALTLNPESPEALAGLVALDMAARKPDAARARIDEQVNNRPNPSANMLMVAGRTYFAVGDRKAAEQYFRRVIERDPTYLQAYVALAQLYMVENRLDAALAEFENLAQRDTRPVGPLTFAGIILQAQGKTAQAREHFERALQLDPSAAVAANNLAWIYSESGGNLDVALQLAQTAHSKLPDTHEVSDTLGFIYYKKNLLPQAVQTLKAAVEKDPTNPSYHYHLGLALAKAGDAPGAAEHLKRALSLKANFDGAADAKAVLLTLPSK